MAIQREEPTMADMAGAPGAVWAFSEHEHRELVRGVSRIHDIACEIGGWLTPDQSVHVLGILDWLDRELEPHIAWEESWLYPEIDRRTGTPWATRAARFDHGQIRVLAGKLRDDKHLLRQDHAGGRLAELRCHLFGLEALVRAHIDREERFLMPLLVDARAEGASTTAPVG
jgi:hemerythrin HHE cation binding domain-containing protein